MRWSLATSLGLHAAILAAALVVLPSPHHEVKPVDAIQVDISNIGEVSKRKAMTTEAEAKPKEKPAPKKTETVKKTDPTAKVAEEVKKAAKEPKSEPPPPETKKEEPKKEVVKKEEPPPPDPADMAALLKKTVEDTPEPKKKEEPKKQETKKAEVKPKEKPKKPEKKPDKKKDQKLDVDQMEAFLNKIDDEKTAPIETSSLDGAPEQGQANLQGTDDQLSATIIEALVQRIRQCWVVPPGAREANIVVKVHFGLNLDGTVVGAPEVMNRDGDPLFDATARSAVAAVLECQAYGFLPPDKYDLWKDLIINFNPNMMFDS